MADQPTMLASGAVLLDTATGTGPGDSVRNYAQRSTFQVAGKTWSGTGSATVVIQVSNDDALWLDAGLITLSLVSSGLVSDGFTMHAPWRFARANVTELSGTGAYVNAHMGA